MAAPTYDVLKQTLAKLLELVKTNAYDWVIQPNAKDPATYDFTLVIFRPLRAVEVNKPELKSIQRLNQLMNLVLMYTVQAEVEKKQINLDYQEFEIPEVETEETQKDARHSLFIIEGLSINLGNVTQPADWYMNRNSQISLTTAGEVEKVYNVVLEYDGRLTPRLVLKEVA